MSNQTFNPDDFEPGSREFIESPERGDSTIFPVRSDDTGQSNAADTDFAALSDVTLLRGRVIKDRYILDEHIAEGGFGAVFKGTDKQFPGKPVAIKLALDSATQKYFVREAKMMGQLKSDFIVDVYDYGFDRGIPYIVMEYLNGKTLEDLLYDNNLMMPDEMIAKCVDQVGRALEAAHGLNLIHRDLKPKNIMLVDCGDRDDQGENLLRFKILDFGIASKTDANDSVKNVTLNGGGTPEYMSPEQIRGADAAATTDVYTFGVLIFQLLTGEVPFSNKTHPQLFDLLNAIVQTEAPRLSDKVGKQRNIPAALDQLIASCLEKDPHRRPSSIREVRHRYRRALNLNNSTTSLPFGYEPPPERPKWLPWTIGTVVLVLVGLLSLLLFRPHGLEIHVVPETVQLGAGEQTEFHLIVHGEGSESHSFGDFTPEIVSAPDGVSVTLLASSQEAGDRAFSVNTDLGIFQGDMIKGVIDIVARIDGEEHQIDVPIEIRPPDGLWDPGPLPPQAGWQKVLSGHVFPSELTVEKTDLTLRLINPAVINKSGPRHTFYISVDCISRKLYEEFSRDAGRIVEQPKMSVSPGQNEADAPMSIQNDISFLNCQSFLNWLNDTHPCGDRGRFRMPTLDEWWAAVGCFSGIEVDDVVTQRNYFRLKNIAAHGFEWTATVSPEGETFDVERHSHAKQLFTPGSDKFEGPLTYREYKGDLPDGSTFRYAYSAKEALSTHSFRIVFEPTTD